MHAKYTGSSGLLLTILHLLFHGSGQFPNWSVSSVSKWQNIPSFNSIQTSNKPQYLMWFRPLTPLFFSKLHPSFSFAAAISPLASTRCHWAKWYKHTCLWDMRNTKSNCPDWKCIYSYFLDGSMKYVFVLCFKPLRSILCVIKI